MEQVDNEFRQEMALALASNTEFIKAANENYNGKYIGHCVSEQILLTISKLDQL